MKGLIRGTVDSRYPDFAYVEVKIWSLFKHENLTTISKEQFSSFPK